MHVAQEEVDTACLPVLTAADLLELGVVEAGERQRMLAAAAALRSRPCGLGMAAPKAEAPGLVPKTPAEEAAQLAAALQASLRAGQRDACGGPAPAPGHAAPGSSERAFCVAGARGGAAPPAGPATGHPAVSDKAERAGCGALPAADPAGHRGAAGALSARPQPGVVHAPDARSAAGRAGAQSGAPAGTPGGAAAGSRAAAGTAPRLRHGPGPNPGHGHNPGRTRGQPLGALGALMAASRQQRASSPAAQGEYSRDAESALLARLCPAPGAGGAGPGSAAGWQAPGGRGAPAAGLFTPSALAAARAAPGRAAEGDGDAGTPCCAGGAGVGAVGVEGPAHGSLWAAARDTRPHLPQAAWLQARVRKRKAGAAAAEAAAAATEPAEAAQMCGAAAAPGSQVNEPCSLKQVCPMHNWSLLLLHRERWQMCRAMTWSAGVPRPSVRLRPRLAARAPCPRLLRERGLCTAAEQRLCRRVCRVHVSADPGSGMYPTRALA